MQLDLTAILTAIYTGYPRLPHSSSAVYGPAVKQYQENKHKSIGNNRVEEIMVECIGL